MQGCRRSIQLMASILAMLASGCLSSGREQSSRSGVPSPSFGLNQVPQQSEPPLENVASGPKSTAKADAIADLDSATENRAAKNGNGKTGSSTTGNGKSGNKLVSWLPGRDKEPPERKPLPLSNRSAAATDDDQLEP